MADKSNTPQTAENRFLRMDAVWAALQPLSFQRLPVSTKGEAAYKGIFSLRNGQDAAEITSLKGTVRIAALALGIDTDYVGDVKEGEWARIPVAGILDWGDNGGQVMLYAAPANRTGHFYVLDGGKEF